MGTPETEIIIRKAMPEDADGIAHVHIRTWQHAYIGIFPQEKLDQLTESLERRTDHWRSSIEYPDEVPALFVAAADGQIVGFAGGGPQSQQEYPYDGELFVIYILPEYQGRGIGRRLMHVVAGAMLAEGYTSLLLWVLKQNQSSRRFYERMGGMLAGEMEYFRWGDSYQLVAYAWENLETLAG